MNRWPTKPLASLGPLADGDWILKENYITDGVRLIQVGDVGKGEFIGKSSRFISLERAIELHCSFLKTGDVLISRMPDPLGRACIFPGLNCPAITAVDITIFRPEPSKVNSKLINYYLNSKPWFDEVLRYATGTTRPRISRRRLDQLGVPVPPLAEQERLVKLLDEADKLRKLRAQADRRTADLIPALFHEIFGDPAINLNNWELVEFMQVVSKEKYSIQRGPFGGAIKKEVFVSDGFKIYEQKNAIRDDFEVGAYFIDANKFKEMENFSVVPDDLIVSCSGTIGRVAIVPSSAKPGIINQALLKFRLDKSKALPKYFKYLLETDHLQRLIFGGSAGSAIKNIKPLIQIKKTVFPLPPLSLQKEFEMRVAEIHDLEAEQTSGRRRLEALFQSMLHRAFNGDL